MPTPKTNSDPYDSGSDMRALAAEQGLNISEANAEFGVPSQSGADLNFRIVDGVLWEAKGPATKFPELVKVALAKYTEADLPVIDGKRVNSFPLLKTQDNLFDAPFTGDAQRERALQTEREKQWNSGKPDSDLNPVIPGGKALLTIGRDPLDPDKPFLQLEKEEIIRVRYRDPVKERERAEARRAERAKAAKSKEDPDAKKSAAKTPVKTRVSG